MADKWTAEQLALIEWLALPRYERTPPTQEMLAQELGVDYTTLWRWKQIDGFQEAVNELARKSVGKKLPEVYGALLRKAEAGSFDHIKLTLELAGEYTSTQKNLNQQSGEVKITFERKGISTVSE